MLFEILLIAFAAFAIIRTLQQYRQKKVSLYWSVIWIILWVGVIVVALAPGLTDVVAQKLGVERGADLLVYTAVVILAYAVYRILVRVERQNVEITELVRELAILEAKKKQHELNKS